MSNFPMVRSNSSVCLPRPREIEREGTVGTLSRVTSVPSLNNLYVGNHYTPSTLYGYRRDYNSYDDWQSDRIHFHNPVHWPTWRYQARRFGQVDPVPDSLGFDHNYPNYTARYKWYSDFLNPEYYRKHRDPHYDRPLWNSWKPYILDTSNVKRAIDLYRSGIVSFNYLDKNWIEPWALGFRREKDWNDVYTKGGRYGARRYFYQFAA